MLDQNRLQRLRVLFDTSAALFSQANNLQFLQLGSPSDLLVQPGAPFGSQVYTRSVCQGSVSHICYGYTAVIGIVWSKLLFNAGVKFLVRSKIKTIFFFQGTMQYKRGESGP